MEAQPDSPQPLPDGAEKSRTSHIWARDPDDWYVEPEWCSEALFAAVPFEGKICDPCCGLGRVLDAAAAAGYQTLGGDIRDRGASARHDFLQLDFFNPQIALSAENIVCNPPYKFGDQFAQEAVARAERKAALLLRSGWANAASRSRWLEALPLRHVLAISPRPSMPPGRVIQSGKKVGNGREDYAWFVFERGYEGKPEFGWLRRPQPLKTRP